MKSKRKPHRPLKYGENTIVVQTRVPKSKKDFFKAKVSIILKKWEVKK